MREVRGEGEFTRRGIDVHAACDVLHREIYFVIIRLWNVVSQALAGQADSVTPYWCKVL